MTDYEIMSLAHKVCWKYDDACPTYTFDKETLLEFVKAVKTIDVPAKKLEDIELAQQIGLGGDKDRISAYARLIRMEFYDILRVERDTWMGSKYRPLVEIALEHCLKRIDPDATL